MLHSRCRLIVIIIIIIIITIQRLLPDEPFFFSSIRLRLLAHYRHVSTRQLLEVYDNING